MDGRDLQVLVREESISCLADVMLLCRQQIVLVCLECMSVFHVFLTLPSFWFAARMVLNVQ